MPFEKCSSPSCNESEARPKRFGDLLRAYRLRHGFSQEYLAQKAGVSIEAIGALERGTRRAPYRSTLKQIAGALELDDAETRELDLLASRARARAHAEGPAHRVANNLPALLSGLLGRSAELAVLREMIAEHRLVSMIGPGGIGKTRVALAVAERLLAGTFEGVWFVDVSPFSETSLLAIAVLSALGLPETPSRMSFQAIVAHLKNKRALLVIDNCEHLMSAVAPFADALLRECSLLHVLATSRQPLGVSGEQIFRLATLRVPKEEDNVHSVPEALEYGGVALFVDRAKAANSEFQLTETLVPTVIEICARLDGLPLAIELAAARMNVLSMTTLAHKLTELCLTLTSGKRGAIPRHRSMRSSLDWSYQLLSTSERRVLRRLSVFEGAFAIEGALEACSGDTSIEPGQVLDAIQALVDKSLLEREPRDDTTWLRLLVTTRLFAAEKLCEAE